MAVAAVASVAPHEPPPTSDLIPGMAVGEYRIDKKIGEGGMGAVYSATHPMIGKRAAIKVISAALGTDASCVGRFVQEARSVNQIGHPNIVDVFAFGELQDGRNYFVMEYLQGESLAERLQKAPMPLGEAIEILDQVADALEAAHEKQIVHRDLKPDNVYLAAVRGGRTMVKLLDFGIAKLSTPDGSGSQGGIQKTRTGMMMGTPGYISPEQARGKNVDYHTDIYALGCMVFEIACGRLPFVADNAMDIVLMHMTQQAPRASEVWPEVPPPLDAIIARMLEKEPSARPSLQEVRAVFSELITSGLVTLTGGRSVAFGSGISRSAVNTPRPQTSPGLALGTSPSTVAPGTQPPTPAPKKKTGLIVGVIAGVVIIGGVGGFLALKGDGSKQPDKVADTTPTTPAPEAPKPEAPKPEAPKPEATKPPDKVEAPKAPGTIDISINVDKAEVTVDGTAVPVTGKTAKASVADEGSHTVVVSAAGHDSFETKVDTKAGASVPIVATLEKSKAGNKHTTTKTTTKTTATNTKTTTGTGTGSATATKTTNTTVDKNATVDPFAN